MTNLILHEITHRQVERFVSSPSHALLLHGPKGSGKKALAEYIARSILKIDTLHFKAYPYQLMIDASEISSEAIETVRKFEKFLSLRVPTDSDINRIVIVADAHFLSPQAQNALLKTIEEPPSGTLIILTAPKLTGVLPTISSRLQAIAVKRPEPAQLTDYFISLGRSQTDVGQAAAITGGLPGVMASILLDDNHPLKQATELARQFLQASIYERFLLADSLAKDKTGLSDLLAILQQMAHSKLLTSTGEQSKRWHVILKSAHEAREQLSNSGQPKLVLDSLLLKLS